MRRRAKRTRSQILVRTPCLRRCSTSRTTSPNQEGVEGTDSQELWMITAPSAILFICTSLRENVLFFLLKEAHFLLARYFLAARCAIRGKSAMIENATKMPAVCKHWGEPRPCCFKVGCTPRRIDVWAAS